MGLISTANSNKELSFSEYPDGLAFHFFKEFARFEYALKAAGFNYGEGEAKPDWDKFSESVRLVFENLQSDDEIHTSVDYILTNPPKKQVIKDGKINWDASLCTNRFVADKILVYVRRVRNNLFHGGKFNGHWFAPERSEELMQHSLIVLEACRNASTEVKEAYDQQPTTPMSLEAISKTNV